MRDWCALPAANGSSDVDPKKSTAVLDICCGTGTIGLTMADRYAQVIGVEIVASAVEDARHNAQLNNVAYAP